MPHASTAWRGWSCAIAAILAWACGHSATKPASAAELPRVGVTFAVPGEHAAVRWFGRGPQENYYDRFTGAAIGTYASTIDEWITHYVRPQENANRTDVRWVEFTGADGRGLRISAIGAALGVSAWPYTADDLARAKHDAELPHRSFTTVNIDGWQMGVGGDNSWSLPVHEKYRLTDNHAVVYRTANHYATSQLHIRDGAILLTQRFAESEFFDSSAIAILVVGSESRARFLNETTVQLSAVAGAGKFTILIGSAATFDRQQDVGDLALKQINAANAKGGFAALAVENAKWWHDFWAKGYVAMHSDDGQADFVGANYLYFLYLMASSSRGNYPPRFGGMLWYTTGDMRRWGSQYWHANTDAYYRDLMPSGHLDLMDPFFSLYFGMYDACALAAQQQWGTKGIYVPEVTFFSGPERIPDSLVQEFQDLFLVRKAYAEASKKFLAYVQTKNCLSARYNFLTFGTFVNGIYHAPDKGAGIFGHCTHFLSGAAGIASQFWQRYEFSGDQAFLRDKAYPMIKGVAEFYAHFPNVKKESDGKYHIYHVNRIESDWDSQDTPSELGAMRTIFPLAIQASRVLGVDETLRPQWQDIADHLASPAPGSGNRGTFDQTKGVYAHQVADEVSAASGLPVPRNLAPAPTNAPVGTTRANSVFGGFVGRGPGAIEPLGAEPDLKRRFLGFNMTGGFIDPAGDGGAQIFRNRLRLREGPGAIDAEHLAGLAFGIHQSLLTSTVNESLTASTIQVFPAWPKDWSVNFKLLARGGTIVSATQQGGLVSAIKLEPALAGTVTLKNPWAPAAAKISRGTTTETLTGDTVTLLTKPGEAIRLTPE